ncbi:MAG TPA: WD40 repeat domain-containing protein [Puia sp.]|nr:WD40 repeat domain-containing protein [Puia sp.]
MKVIMATGLMLLMAVGVLAQQPCADYDRLIGEARECANRGQLDLAIAKLNSAVRSCDAQAAEANKMMKELLAKVRAEDSLKNDNGRRAVQSSAPATAPATAASQLKPDTTRTRTIPAFIARNRKLIHRLSRADSAGLLADVTRFFKTQETARIDSLLVFFRFLYAGKTNETTYWNCLKVNQKVTAATAFPADRKEPFFFFSLRLMDYLYFESLLDLEYAMKMLPAGLTGRYEPRVAHLRTELEARRAETLRDYLVADTIKGLPGSTLFARQTGDNRNFAWGYSDYSNYKKVEVRYLNLSLPDFSLTTDSVQSLADSGRFYNVSAVAGNYKYRIGREIDYSLKPNKVEYRRIAYSDAGVKKLMDSTGTPLMDLTAYSTNAFFFSPDGSHFATWNEASELLVTDVSKRMILRLPDNQPALTESFSSDSKKIAYFNSVRQVIYIADLASGKVLQEIPGAAAGIDSIANIDFTGGDRYLKVNNDDTLTLFDLAARRVVRRFSKALVSELVVSPDGQELLFTCHTSYSDGKKNYRGSLGIVTDTALNVKARLYSDCGNYFFSPDGDYIIGYSDFAIMRWPLTGGGGGAVDLANATCLSLAEMVQYKCLPLSRWAAVTDADLMETGARAFKDLAEEDTVNMVRILYYQLSEDLFHELASGNTKNTRWERVPFFDDWYNWVRRRMGYRDFGNQFVQEFNGVREFESYVNSPDSVYPQQLYYAAYGEQLLASLYDSMRIYNRQLIDLEEKEIVLRCRVFAKDTENTTNNDYLRDAFRNLDAACDSVGWRDLLNGHYPQRLAVYAGEVRLLAQHFHELPDSFGLRSIYINALAQYAPSFLYLYASRVSGPGGHLLDSTLFYAREALALRPDPFDSARLLLVEARAYLLQPGALEKSLALYRQVRQHYPDFTTKMMLSSLGYLKEAGERKDPALLKVEEYLKKDEK